MKKTNKKSIFKSIADVFDKYIITPITKFIMGFGNLFKSNKKGIERVLKVEYTLAQWVDNFKSFLRTAMSYDNFTNIKEFIGGPTLKLLSESAKASINK